MSKVPELQVLISHANSGYAVTGFDEVDKYGYRNSTLWNNVRRHCEKNKIAEIDRLKILARELLRQNEELSGQLIKAAENSMTNFLVRPSSDGNPVG